MKLLLLLLVLLPLAVVDVVLVELLDLDLSGLDAAADPPVEIFNAATSAVSSGLLLFDVSFTWFDVPSADPLSDDADDVVVVVVVVALLLAGEVLGLLLLFGKEVLLGEEVVSLAVAARVAAWFL